MLVVLIYSSSLIYCNFVLVAVVVMSYFISSSINYCKSVTWLLVIVVMYIYYYFFTRSNSNIGINYCKSVMIMCSIYYKPILLELLLVIVILCNDYYW